MRHFRRMMAHPCATCKKRCATYESKRPAITTVPNRIYYDGSASTYRTSVTAALIALGTSEDTVENRSMLLEPVGGRAICLTGGSRSGRVVGRRVARSRRRVA